MDIFDLLDQSQFIVYNRKLAHKLGVHETIILMDLIAKYKYFKSQDSLTEWGYFFNSATSIEESTALTRRKQDTAFKVLKEMWLVKAVLQWVPATRYFKINFEKLRLLLESESPSTTQKSQLHKSAKLDFELSDERENQLHESAKLDSTNRKGNNNKYNNKTTTTNVVVVEKNIWNEPKENLELQEPTNFKTAESSNKEILENLSEVYWAERVAEVVNALEQITKGWKTEISNPMGWILSALKNNYEFNTAEKLLKENKQKKNLEIQKATQQKRDEEQRVTEEKQRKAQLVEEFKANHPEEYQKIFESELKVAKDRHSNPKTAESTARIKTNHYILENIG